MSLVLNGTTGISNGAGTGIGITRPAFWVRTTSNWGASAGVIIWDTVMTNIGGCYSTSTGRFVAPVAGRYMFACTVGRYDPGNNDISQFWRKNGSQIGQAFDPANNSSTNQWHYFCNTIVLDLMPNDYVEYYHNTGAGSTTAANGSFFCGHLIG